MLKLASKNKNKMKKIIAFLGVIYFTSTSYAFAEKLDVDANYPSGEYNSVIEVYLNKSKEVNKIFYYTDWIWRIDNQMLYENPIVIKSDTELNYYGVAPEYQSTDIEWENYTFKYSDKVSLDYKKWFLIITNNEKESVNMWYWKVIWENIDKEIKRYTYLKAGKTIKIPYEINYWEEVKLESPNWEIKSTFKEKTDRLKVNVKSIEITQKKEVKELKKKLKNQF